MNEIDQLPPETVNPLLERVHLPGETFRVPSRGLFYNNGELDSTVSDGEVHILPMTSFDEILIKTPDLLFSGKALERVFARCIPQIKKTEQLLSKDVDYLIVCLRKVTYGDNLEITYQHKCEGSKEHTYNVNIGKIVSAVKEIDPTTLGKVFEVKMPNSQVVKLHPARFGDIVKILRELNPADDDNVTAEEQYERHMFSVQAIIDSVDGITDRAQIREWIEAVPSAWITLIQNTIQQVENWGTENQTKITCKDCKKRIPVTIPINPLSFFS